MIGWLEDLIPRLRLTTDTAHALQLCLEEAVTNVLSHAFEPGGAHDVRVALWCDGPALHAEVEDDGRPFDPLAFEPRAAPKDLEAAEIGGLGIKLMRSFAQSISYARCGGTNRLRLTFPTD